MHKRLKEFVETMQQGVEGCMNEQGYALKGLFMFNLPAEDAADAEESIPVATMPFPDEFDGTMMNAFIQMFRPQYDVVVMVAETWKSSNPDCAPSEDPDRTEAVIITAYNRKDTYLYISDMTRKPDGTVTMGKWEDMSEGAGGRMMKPYRNPVTDN